MADPVGNPSLQERYVSIQEKIGRTLQAIGRPAGDAKLLAVSKTHGPEMIEELYRLGQRDFGENYAQELAEKAKILRDRGCSEIRWHFIGHLQSNKAKLIAPWIWAIHSVDSSKTALELAKRRAGLSEREPIRAFLEVNLDGEDSKNGLSPEEALQLAHELSGKSEIQDLFHWEGLMAIPNPTIHIDPAKPFRTLRELASQLPRDWNRKLSMGMSGDFEAALREGSHWIRVGTALFGPRKSPDV